MPDTTLCIADIDPLVDESAIQKAFDMPVTGITIMRDPLGRGQGHATVAVADEEASRLLSQGHMFIGSSMCRVFANDRQFEQIPKINGEGIFIKNLIPEVTVEELHSAFSSFGEIISLRIALNPYGVPRGFAYASYNNKESVNSAISEMNGKEKWGRKLYVGHNLPRRERVNKYDESKVEYTNLFIKGVGQSTQEQDFFDFFTQIGPIDSYSMPIDEFGTPRGFGFVNYKQHADAVRAVQKLNNSKLGGRSIHVSRAQQREKPQRSNQEAPNIYVKNLGLDVNDEVLGKEFSRFGSIASAKVMLDEAGRSRGFGFVCFYDPQAADAAISEMNGAQVWGNSLYVALAQRKGRPWNNRQIMPQMIPMNNFGVPMYMPMMMPMQMPMYPYYPESHGSSPVPPMVNQQPPSAGQTPQAMSPVPPAAQPAPRRRQQDYGSSLSAAIASAENQTAEKEVIGEALYPKVAKHTDVDSDDLASRITGILLEEKREDLLVWVDHDEMLNKRISQAVNAYKKWENKSE